MCPHKPLTSFQFQNNRTSSLRTIHPNIPKLGQIQTSLGRISCQGQHVGQDSCSMTINLQPQADYYDYTLG